ncbi:hypothetical protein ACFLT7_00635 [candidate division KSB1 bacterium]
MKTIKTMTKLMISLVAPILCSLGIATAGTIPLNLDEPMGKARTNWPIRSGVPLPKGEVKSLSALRLLDPAGRSAPLQATRLAVWPDMSLKWVLLDFDADLDAGKGATYRLEYGKGVKGPTPAKKISIAETAGQIEVNTGELKFTVPKSGGRLIDQVWLDSNGDGKYSEAEKTLESDGITGFFQVVRSEDYRVGRSDINGTTDSARLQVESAVVEIAGPLKAVICIRGHYLHQHLAPSPFTVRLYARSGRSSIRVSHTFVYTGEPKVDFPAAIGLDIPLAGNPSAMDLTFGTDSGSASFRSGESGYDHGSLVQMSHLDYRVWKAAGDRHGPNLIFQGQKSPGWADLSTQAFGLTVSMRHMWQEYPQEISLDGRTGRVKACFWPVHGPVMDLRRYGNQMFGTLGETTFFSRTGNFQSEAKATALSKTHECVLDFHSGKVQESAALAVSDWLNNPSIIYVTPEWYRDTRVLGYFHVLDKDNFPRLEKTLSRYIDFFLTSQEYWGWYSWLDYGDVGHMWGSKFQDGPDGQYEMRHEWDYDIGRWGWTNTEGMPGLWFHLQWMRTGDRRYFLAAEAEGRHSRDIDVFHWGNNLGRGHTRHNVNHWGDGDYEDRISGPIGYSLEYYLTGDERSRDVIETIVDGHYIGHKEPVGTATLSAHLYGVLVRWEMTGDKKYDNLLRKAVDAFIDAQNPETGAYPDGNVVIVGTGQPTGADPMKSDGNGMFIHNFGLMQAVIGYYNLTDYKRLGDSLIRHADLCAVRKGGATNNYYILAFATRVTGDQKYTKTIRERMAKQQLYGDQVNPDPKDWTGPEAYMNPISTYSVSAIGHDMPYVMEALGKE